MSGMNQEEWLSGRLGYLRGLKAPSDQQKLLLLLAEKPDRSTDDERKLRALIRAEKAAERAQKARASAARIIDAEKAAARKARDHELYKSAGLLILAGIVDSKTGKPIWGAQALLGGLLAMRHTQERDAGAVSAWHQRGEELMKKMKS